MNLSNPWSYIASAVVILALVASIIFGLNHCKEIDQDNVNQQISIGQNIEKSKSLGETVNAVENAKNVVDNPTSRELNVVCGKYDRNCSNNRP